MRFIYLLMAVLILAAHCAHAEEMRGIWAECEGRNTTFDRRESIEEMFGRVTNTGFNTLFMQVYRGNRSWYKSTIADSAPYRAFYANEELSPLRLALDISKKHGIELHAWMNMFRVWSHKNAKVFAELGRDAVTRDRKKRSLLDYPKGKLPDGGYWLDPGDPKVHRYLLSVIGEVLTRYPDVAGIHLDYTRYPFSEGGETDFGYGTASVARYKKHYGLDPFKLGAGGQAKWDRWRRAQLSSFIKQAGKLVHARGKKLSIAVIANPEKCRDRAFQDWPLWLREGHIDFVAPMNYSDRRSTVHRYNRACAKRAGTTENIMVGLGAYKFLDTPGRLVQLVHDCRKAGFGGVVLFSYDNMDKNPALFPLLREKAFSTPPEKTLKKRK